MAKAVKKREVRKRRSAETAMPLSRTNFLILGAGLVTITAGYLAMMEGSVEGFLPLVAAPILLIVGYCVLIPLGILYRHSGPEARETADKTSVTPA
jgi:hypothetical protein